MKPYFMTPEIETRITDMLDSHPPDISIIADTIYTEYPELTRRQAGQAVMHVKGIRAGKRVVMAEWLEQQDLDNTYEAFLAGTR